jgi:putative ABC transport system ATP-binding protein
MLPLADRVVEMQPQIAIAHAEPVRVELAPGEELFAQGSMGELIYVVESGEIDIVRATDDGRWEHVATLPAGQYFGEIGPLFGLPRSASARARTAAVVTGYTVRDFRQEMGVTGTGDILAHAGDAAAATAEPA